MIKIRAYKMELSLTLMSNEVSENNSALPEVLVFASVFNENLKTFFIWCVNRYYLTLK